MLFGIRLGLKGVVLSVLAMVAAVAGQAAEIKNSACLDCHSDQALFKTNAAGKGISLFVNETNLLASVHRTNSCVSCHADVTGKHPDDGVALKSVQCGRCHEKQTESYGASVHGLELAKGNKAAATCNDCHGEHNILPPTLPASPLYFSKLAQTCGACHDQEARDVEASIHGKAVAAGHREAPTCTDCHSEHQIQDLRASSSQAISVDVCSRCHASERMNIKFNLPQDRVKTFFSSYHGEASAANCASCHGFHKVLPSSEAQSTVNPANLVATCGKCHPGANENYAHSKIHVDLAAATSGSGIGEKASWWVRRVYLGLIVGTIGFMLVHNLLLFAKKVRARSRAADLSVTRMNLSQRRQHLVLAVSFIVLALTGFALKYPDSWLAKAMGSNEMFRRWTHRGAGVAMLLVGIYHIYYILKKKEGRQLVKDMFPSPKDSIDLLGALRYLVSLSPNKPKIGRFGYAEKMEYWAVVWGTIIMGATGLVIWFKMDVTRFLPRWAVDVGLTIHYYEAILACLAILVWHFYHVIFDPDVYPLNPACWKGKVSKHWQEEEHPLEEVPESAPEDKEEAPEPSKAAPDWAKVPGVNSANSADGSAE